MSITFDQVSYIYQPNTPFAHRSLSDVSLMIDKGDFMAVIGHTGSGKSTLIQHLNALLKATHGRVSVDDFVIEETTKDTQLKPLRQKVGIVFQFPEGQLFEETVLKDVVFGPLNFGVSKELAYQKAVEALKLVGIDETLFERSPFELSGGQMRRVAIAGILAMQPDILVLDEPTAGLDPQSRLRMMQLFKQLHENGMTVVLITHQMNDVWDYANKVALLNKGKLVYCGDVPTLFSDDTLLEAHHIDRPNVLQLAHNLKQKGITLSQSHYTTDTLMTELSSLLKGGNDVR